MTIRAINIGGGPGFKADGWLNIDEVADDSTWITRNSVFPVPDASVDLVYSSHTLEHLNDETVSCVLLESHRALKDTGVLLIKLPDFEAIRAAWRRNDIDFFKGWGFARHQQTLPSKGMPDTISSRAAFLFCGFWNKQYGHHFGKRTPDKPGAYCGCPVMPDDELQAVLGDDNLTPHDIATILRAHVIEQEHDYSFNHQNAWSRAEFQQLLVQHRFLVMSTLAPEALPLQVPGLHDMLGISMYFTAAKVVA